MKGLEYLIVNVVCPKCNRTVYKDVSVERPKKDITEDSLREILRCPRYTECPDKVCGADLTYNWTEVKS